MSVGYGSRYQCCGSASRITSMRTRIQPFTLMLFQVRLFILMLIQVRLFPLMLIQVWHFILMLIRIRLPKMMRIRIRSTSCHNIRIIRMFCLAGSRLRTCPPTPPPSSRQSSPRGSSIRCEEGWKSSSLNMYKIMTFFAFDAPVLLIRDVYSGSRILIFTHSGSRISDPGSKNSNKREGWKNLLSNFFL